MRAIKETLKTWPTRKNGEPIFRTSNDAIFYAQQAVNEPSVVEKMKYYREQAHRVLRTERAKLHPNLDRMMEYATKAQFFRECWEEIERIQHEEATQ